MELHQKSKIKYLGLIVNKILLKVFYTWKMAPHMNIETIRLDSIEKINKSYYGRIFSNPKNSKKIMNNESSKKITKVSPLEIPAKRSNLIQDKKKTTENVFENLKASLQNKAQNLNYRRSVKLNTCEINSIKNYQEKNDINHYSRENQGHQRSNTYDAIFDLAVVSTRNS